MLIVVISMIAILFVSGMIATYVAFPHRGTPVPAASWLGEAMVKATDALPILDESERAALRR